MNRVQHAAANESGVLSILKFGILSYINDKSYMLALIITALGSYGFLITHYSISVDDLEYDRYYFGELIAQGRLSATIFHRLLGLTDNFIWIEDFIGVLLLCIGVMLLCVVLDQFAETKNRISQICFSCIFVSYPLHSEFFSYNGCMITVGFSLILISFSLLLLSQHLKKKNILYFIASVVFLFFTVSWYESLLLIYIGMVLAVIILKQINGQKYKFKQIFQESLSYAIPLIIAVISEFIISNFIRVALHLEQSNIAATELALGTFFRYAPGYHIKHLVEPVLADFLVESTYYFPITLLFFAIIIMSIIIIHDLIKKHSLYLFLCEAALMLLLIGFTPLLYLRQPYRTCQYFAFFISFEVFFILYRMSKSNAKKLLYKIVCFAFTVLIVLQICKINYYFTNDYLRYECEKNTLQSIGYELQHNFDLSKPVTFVGRYKFPEKIQSRREIDENNKLFNKLKNTEIYELYYERTVAISEDYKIQESNCQSYINWAMNSFEKTGRSLIKFLSFLGYDGIKEASEEQVKEARLNSDDMPSWPQKGSIADCGDYIVVKF